MARRDYAAGREPATQEPVDEWRKTTLGTVADFISGGTPSKSRSDYWGGSMPWVSAKDMKRLQLRETEDKVTTAGVANGTREVPANTVLILVRGMTLLNDVPVCITERPMTFNQDVKALRPKSTVAEDFLPYLVLGNKDRLLGLVDLAGHGTGRLNTDEVKALEIDLPPLPEQRAIAHILGTLDDKIELNRRMNETLEEMARALFKSWFVDFDPVRAKSALKQQALRHHATPAGEPSRDSAAPAGEWTVERARAYLAGMDPQIVDLFPDRLVDSELGEIPEGWEVKSLRGFSNLNPESWSRTDSPPEVEYVDLANTKWGVIETTQHFPWNDAPSRAKRVLRSGDTIVGTVRPGNGSYSLVGSGGLTGSTGFAVLRPSHSRFRELIYLAATSPENIERLSHRADGAAYPAVRPEVIAETEVSIPASETGRLDRFSMAVGSILDKIEATRSESSFLTAQRNALLPKLVSGQVWVEQAQAKPSHEKPL